MRCTGKQQKKQNSSNNRYQNNRYNNRDNNQRNRDSKLRRRKKRRNRRIAGCMSAVFLMLCIAAAGIYAIKSLAKPESLAAEYEASKYRDTVYREEKLFADELCVATDDVSMERVSEMSGVPVAALFDVNGKKVDFSYGIHERRYPASVTKILTALVAIKNGNLDDMVTVSENAAASSFAADEQTCGLIAGDQLTLRDLLYGLILYSGNDNAVAIAEHVAGNMESFVELMNAQAAELMATNTHFINSNGLHSEDHYTTAYDLYLIFNECIKHQEFMDMISADSYTVHVTQADGSKREMEHAPTNYYASGEAALPTGGVTVVGGKTGTTDQAGNCLILLDRDENENPYISIVMGADTKPLLYEEMTAMIEAIPNKTE